jgi:MFS family permease
MATTVFALCTLALAMIENVLLLVAAMFAAGLAWIAILSLLNLAAQTVVPEWVKGRALSFYLLMFQGGLAVGSVIWGGVASQAGTQTALQLAAAFLIVGLALAPRYRLTAAEGLDHTPTLHWPAPDIVVAPRADDGPVLISVEYHINPESSTEFVATLHQLRRVRLRDGATSWQLYRDTADSSRYVEEFVVESWAEHLRQHERVTAEDRKIEDLVRSYHVDSRPPAVRHLIGAT